MIVVTPFGKVYESNGIKVYKNGNCLSTILKKGRGYFEENVSMEYMHSKYIIKVTKFVTSLPLDLHKSFLLYCYNHGEAI
ncbi:hypothetical protein J2S13_002422 [Oikeobacillus pervagus]|uniref:Uncharacterized protein n=1 Tax=Oikeobacillus pervagus TaxID=1325931 RepID=A0AAJ1WJT5_9BACI|nr:hypothetical protein [Oikeobacillus pervagus]